MIWAFIQVVALLLAGLKLAAFDGNERVPRRWISILASAVTGACFALAATIVLEWPEAVSNSNIFTATLSGAFSALIIKARGNVAEALRILHIMRY